MRRIAAQYVVTVELKGTKIHSDEDIKEALVDLGIGGALQRRAQVMIGTRVALQGLRAKVDINRPRGELRIRQISSRTYRCNWYLDHAIVLSRFVQAEAVGDGVIITDKTILGMKSPSGYHA